MLLLVTSSLFSQTLIQIGFIVKKALPTIEKIAIIDLKENEIIITKKAKSAQLVSKIKFTLYTIKNLSGVTNALKKIYKLKNTLVLLRTNNKIFNEKTVNYIALKLFSKKIPVVTDRSTDTLKGAILTISKNGNKGLELHVSKLVSNAYGLTFDSEFLKTAIIDVE
jgi:hypothetical protein